MPLTKASQQKMNCMYLPKTDFNYFKNRKLEEKITYIYMYIKSPQCNTSQTYKSNTYDRVTYQFRFEVAYCVFIQLKISSLPVFHLPEMNTDIRLLFLRMSNVNNHLIILK